MHIKLTYFSFYLAKGTMTSRRKRNLKKKFLVFQINLRTRLVLKNYLIVVQVNMLIKLTLKQLKMNLKECGKIQKLKKKRCQNLKKSKIFTRF